MARELTIELATIDSGKDRRAARSTARAFAAVAAALLITMLVIDRSSAAIEADGTSASSSFVAGNLSLSVDDAGRSLFDLRNMAPGRTIDRCVQVTYTGSILPVEVALVSASAGDLANYIGLEVAAGSGGSFGSCDGFVESAPVFDGTLAALDNRRLDVTSFVSEGETATFRFRFTLTDDERALGAQGAADFRWEATPS